jgi:hypothetical protein
MYFAGWQLAVFQALRAGLAVKHRSLSHTGRASNAEKQPTDLAQRVAMKMGPAAALLVPFPWRQRETQPSAGGEKTKNVLPSLRSGVLRRRRAGRLTGFPHCQGAHTGGTVGRPERATYVLCDGLAGRAWTGRDTSHCRCDL